MFLIKDGREYFYQWDLDRQLIVQDPSIKEVHFCNRTDNCSLVCETFVEDGVTLVNVPNILLQTGWRIHAYAYDGSATKYEKNFDVCARSKPEDYVYTETEVKAWDDLSAQISEKPGVKTENGGEIFGDYETNVAIGEYSTAFGASNIAGQMGYYIKSIDKANKKIYLLNATESYITPTFSSADNTDTSFETPAYAVEDVFSIITGGHYCFCNSIGSIQNNVITYKGELPFDNFVTTDIQYDDNTLFVSSKPEVGLVNISTTSFVEGIGNIASGSYSHAEGVGSISGGNFSHAEGWGTITGYIAHAEGIETQALNTAAHSEGVRTMALGVGSHAEGVDTRATENTSHAEGNSTRAQGLMGSHAEGNKTEANGASAHAEGEYTRANGVASHTEGYETKTFEKYAHAEGWKSEASGAASHAEGISTKAESNYSHAEGQSTHAKGIGAHAEGYGAKAYADYAHAEGKNCRASGVASHAGGISSSTNADYARAFGNGAIASSTAQLAHGKYNIEDKANKYAHIVGNGTAGDDRKNIYTLDWDGNGSFKGNVEASAIILKSPNGTKYKITVSDNGTLTTAAI